MFNPSALLQADAYPHPVTDITLVETHMSWVYLTGKFAYKVKKPVQFAFADFTSLHSREHFCQRELELNRRFAPDIYLDVVPLAETGEGWCIVGDKSSAQEWAVRMRQFPGDALCDVALDEARLTIEHLFDFGQRLATQHASLPVVQAEPIAPAIMENFTSLASLQLEANLVAGLETMRKLATAQVATHGERLALRATTRHSRRCHGDLHLKNLVLLDDQIQAFDCLEFNEALGSIDVWADVGFLFMDLSMRGRDDLAYAFVDGYLDVSGDYEGSVLLPLFAAYRAMVRAKVAGLTYAQHPSQRSLSELKSYLGWAQSRSLRSPGTVLLTHGFSGSGKSYWSRQLVPQLPAIRIRSDIYRKVSAGFAPGSRTAKSLAGGVYTTERSAALYTQMVNLALSLSLAGETVIIDAAFLQRAQRVGFYQGCSEAGVLCLVLSFSAPDLVLRQRLEARKNDPSEADETVLNWQIEHAQPLESDEPVVLFDSEYDQLLDLLERIALAQANSTSSVMSSSISKKE